MYKYREILTIMSPYPIFISNLLTIMIALSLMPIIWSRSQSPWNRQNRIMYPDQGWNKPLNVRPNMMNIPIKFTVNNQRSPPSRGNNQIYRPVGRSHTENGIR